MEIHFTLTMAPVSAEVRFSDRAGCDLCAYFRSRHEAWTFEAWVGTDPAGDPPERLEFYAEGCWSKKGGSSASHMPVEVARSLIDSCAQIVIEQRDSLKRFEDANPTSTQAAQDGPGRDKSGERL